MGATRSADVDRLLDLVEMLEFLDERMAKAFKDDDILIYIGGLQAKRLIGPEDADTKSS